MRIDDLLVNYSQKPYKDPRLVYLEIIDYVEKYFYRKSSDMIIIMSNDYLRVTPTIFVVTNINLSSWESDNLTFTMRYSVISH